MNLHAIVSGAIGTINPNQQLTVQVSTGSTKNADFTSTPTYAPAQTVPGQVQALSWGDLRQLEGLNIQGVTHAIYLNGDIEGLVRSQNKGGDLITDAVGNDYLVTTVLENWSPTAGWTKVAVVLQDGS